MEVLGILLVTSLACGVLSREFLKQTKLVLDIDDKRDDIVNIFRNITTLTVLLKNYEQPEGIIQFLGGMFGSAVQSFVVFNFFDDESYEDWAKHCKLFLSDSSTRTAYYERFFMKSHKPNNRKNSLDFFEDFEPNNNEIAKGDSLDPMSPLAAEQSSSEAIQEKFAESLDRWFSFRKYGFVLICRLEEFKLYLGCLLNRSGTFLIIIDDSSEPIDSTGYSEIAEVMSKAWNSATNLKLFILIFKEIYVLNPFIWNVDAKRFGVLEKLENGLRRSDFRNLNGYPINVDLFASAYSVPTFWGSNFTHKLDSFYGPDVEVARFFQQQMNVTINVVKNQGKFGVKFPNGTLTGALGSLQNRKADWAMTSFFMKVVKIKFALHMRERKAVADRNPIERDFHSRHSENSKLDLQLSPSAQQDYDTRAAEFAYPLYTDELCVVVKKAARIPSELLPLVIFDEYLWLTLAIAGIIIGIIWSLIRRFNNVLKRPKDMPDRISFYIKSYNFTTHRAQQSERQQYSQVLIDTWLLFLSIPMRRFTRMQNERLFLAAVCLVSMIFVSMYQSGLATVFLKPRFFKDITSLAQLDSSGQIIQVKYAGYLEDVFPNDSSSMIRNLRNKMRLVDTSMYAMDLVDKQQKVATITRKSTVQLDNAVYFIRQKLHIIDKECPKKYFLAYMLPASSIYLERINELLLDIQRYGFIHKWIVEMNFLALLTNMKEFQMNQMHSKTLSLENLKFPFIVLICGSSFALALLLFEVTFYYTRNNVRRRKKRYVTIKAPQIGLTFIG